MQIWSYFERNIRKNWSNCISHHVKDELLNIKTEKKLLFFPFSFTATEQNSVERSGIVFIFHLFLSVKIYIFVSLHLIFYSYERILRFFGTMIMCCYVYLTFHTFPYVYLFAICFFNFLFVNNVLFVFILLFLFATKGNTLKCFEKIFTDRKKELTEYVFRFVSFLLLGVVRLSMLEKVFFTPKMVYFFHSEAPNRYNVIVLHIRYVACFWPVSTALGNGYWNR